MFNRITYLLVALAIIVPWFFFDRYSITPFEIRYYVAVAFVLFTVLTFGVLRVYNAMVQNTTYLAKVGVLLQRFTNSLRATTTKFTVDVQKVSSDLHQIADLFRDRFKKMTDDITRAISQMESNNSEKRSDKD